MVNARSKGRRGERVINEVNDLLGIQLEVNYAQTFGGGHDLLNCPGYYRSQAKSNNTSGHKKLVGSNSKTSIKSKSITMSLV